MVDVSKQFSWKVGRGDQILFWEDSWVMVGYLLKINFHNYIKFLPKDYSLWQIWALSLKMGGNGLSLGDEICLTVRWG